MTKNSSSEFELQGQGSNCNIISPCVVEISPNSCDSSQHRSPPPDVPAQKLYELNAGKEVLQDDNGFMFEDNLYISELQAARCKVDSKCDILTLHANLPEVDLYSSEYTEAEWTKLITLQLQSYVHLEKNNIQLLLARNQIVKAQCDREYKEMIVELEAVKSDSIQYEDYIGSKCYSFRNETWEYLKNVGHDELRARKQAYLQQKMHLKQKRMRCWEEMKIYHQIMTYLNEEELRRQQRIAEYSTNMLHHRMFRKHLLQNILNRLTEEQKEVETRKCLILNEMKKSRPLQQNNTDCILNAQKLGCTFDFLLKHRLNKDGSVHAYKNMVDIFEKRMSPETSQSIYCLQTLLLSALENYKARLNQEMVLCLKNLNRMFPAEEERQARLDVNEICPHVLPGFSDPKGASENLLLDISNLPGLGDKNHEDIYAEFTINKVPEVEATNIEEIKKTNSSQPVLQVSTVFREQPNDLDIIENSPNLELEKTRESNQTEKKKQNKPLKERGEKLGSKEQEYVARKLQQVKLAAERRAKIASLKKGTSLVELLEEKLTTHVTNIDSELCEIRKENEALRNTLDKVLRILEIKNNDNEQLDKKGKELLVEGEQFIVQDDRIGLLRPSLENTAPRCKGGQIAQGQRKDRPARNKGKAEQQLSSQDRVVTETKQENILAQKGKTERQLHSDGDPSGSTSRTEIKQNFMAHKNHGIQSDTAQIVILGGKDVDANKTETPGINADTVQGVKAGSHISPNENLLLEDQMDHADRKRNKMFQKLSLLLDCIEEDDGPLSKHIVKHIKQIIEVNKLMSPQVVKKLIGTIAARSQQAVPVYHGPIKWAVKKEVSISLTYCNYP
jgi:hypothetical protein